MSFKPFNVSIPHIFYALLGGFVVLFGMFSLFIREKLYIGEACLAFVFGVIIGPYGANIFDPRSWGGGSAEVVNTITLEVTRVILAVGVFAIGVELPKAYMQRHWKSLLFLLFPVMTWGWFVSAGLIFALVPGLNFLSSLAVAACLTPTDPILAAAVVGGKYADKHVPTHLRHLLAAESGCNDGAAFPFLYISLYLLLESSNAHAVQDWFLITWLYEVLLGIVFGAVLGFGFRHLMKFCERRDLIDRQSYVAQYISLAMMTIGITTLLGSDDLLAAFSCGTAFAWDGFFNRQTEQSVFSSVLDLLFNIAAFVFIGAWMPFNSFHDATLTLSVWRLIVIAILILLLRRLPIILLLYKWIPDVKTLREAVFSGHFGPIGVGAIFISTLAAQALGGPSDSTATQVELLAASIQPIVAFMVLCSITIHGLSIPFFSLGRRVHSVSRTWSRHQSTDPSGPEWAMHTRQIAGPEDVVINKDSVAERGQYVSDKPVDGTELKPSLFPSDVSSGSVGKKGGATEPVEDKTAGRAGRADPPPDGEETVAEWREGSDIVIERRAGPGDEVEVEVVHDAADDNGHSPLRMIKQIVRDIEADVERHSSTLRLSRQPSHQNSVDVHEFHDDRKDTLAATGTEQGANVSHEASLDDDEEGWCSEEENNGSNGEDGTPPGDGEYNRRIKASRYRTVKKQPTVNSGSFRRKGSNFVRYPTLRQQVKQSSSPPPKTASKDDTIIDNERGRSLTASTSRSVIAPFPRALQNQRIESLRSVTRPSSPARSLRSVRFADGDNADNIL